MASCEPLKIPAGSIPNLKSLPGTGDGQSFSPAITMSTRTGVDSQVEDTLTKKKAIDLTVSDFTFSSPENLPLPQVVHKSFGYGIAAKFAFSFVAASCAELATYPLDLTKTRLQLQGEVAVNQFNQIGEVKKRGMIRTAHYIATEEGFLKLWQGMTPALYRHLIYSGTRMTIYEFLRDSMKNENGELPLWKAVIGGVFAGGFAQFLASPADLVKVRVQAEGRRRLLNLPPRVKNSWHAFTQIVNEGGVLSLWRGWGPNVQRAALVNLGDLTTYDTAKRVILKHTGLRDNTFTHALSSMFSGLIAASLGTPADVIKTRIMNQPTDEKGRGLVYKGSVDCFIQAVRKEGFFSLYKGFIPCWLRMGPWSLTFWMTYEKLRNLGGVKSF